MPSEIECELVRTRLPEAPSCALLWSAVFAEVTWVAFGLGKLDCDENRKISRNEGDAFDPE